MFVSVLLFIFYTVLFSFFLKKMACSGVLEVDSRLAISGFFVRVLLGCAYGFLYGTVYHGDDTWKIHWISVEETRQLVDAPMSFLSQLFQLNTYTGSYEMSSAWESVEFGFLIKLLAFLNFFSGSNYYVNVVLFSMISFWGAYFIYKLFSVAFQVDGRLIRGTVFFFLPVVFWTSGIRKDGLLFLGFSLFLYSFYHFLQRPRIKFLAGVILAVALLLLNRHMLTFTLLPAVILFFLLKNTHYKASYVLTGFIVLLTALIFFLPSELSLLMLQKRQSFEALSGSSRIPMPKMDGSWSGILLSAPQSLYNTLLQPLPSASGGLLRWLSGVETIFVFLAILGALFFPTVKSMGRSQIALLFSVLVICTINYLIIGLIVPFTGATVRYRAPFEVLLLTTAVVLLDVKRLRRQFKL